MQYVLCESKIRQRMSPVSVRLNLDFINTGRRLELLFHIKLVCSEFQKRVSSPNVQNA